MNSIHDLGGMTCFGPVAREHDEPLFRAEWERRVFAMNLAAGGLGSIDASRHASERMDPLLYLTVLYYERWLAGMEARAKELGVLSEEEIASGVSTTKPPAGDPPANAEIIEAIVRGGMASSRNTGRLQPRFDVGDRVRARNLHPPGHTRLPRYVRGHLGAIAICHGTHVFLDSNAHGKGEDPQPLYCVRFEATELWGADAPPRDRLYVDLWEDYLEPVATGVE